MAIITKVSQPSNNLTGSLNGRIVLDEGRGKISITEQNGNERTRLDIQGLKTYNPDIEEVVRTGEMPDGTYGTTAAKPGETIQTIYGV